MRRLLPRFEVKARNLEFQPGIDVFRLNQLYDELEIEEFRRKLANQAAKGLTYATASISDSQA